MQKAIDTDENSKAETKSASEGMALIRADLEQHVAHEVKDLVSALQSGPDLIMTVLRFHLLSENLLERVILAKLARGDRVIEKANLSFVQKLVLVDSFDVVSDSAIQALRHLNSLRNKCSHQKGKRVEFSDIEIVGRPLGKEFTKIKRDCKDSLDRLLVHTFVKIYTIILSVVLRIEITDDLKEKVSKHLQGAT